jgi:hypothetical protein
LKRKTNTWLKKYEIGSERRDNAKKRKNEAARLVYIYSGTTSRKEKKHEECDFLETGFYHDSHPRLFSS